MKLMYYRKSNMKRSNAKGFGIHFDHILFVLCVTAFFILILVQTALISPSVRTFLEVQNGYEGQPLEAEEFLYAEGSLELKLLSVEDNENVQVMVNGSTAAVFNTNTVKINVKDGDVVEIDTSADENEIEVEVISQSTNISNKCTGTRVKAKAEVKRLIRVEID